MSKHEYLDVLNEDGSFTGASKLRSEVHATGSWHRVMHLWVVNKKGQLLVQRRSLSKETWPGRWDISIAGHIVAGDDAISTASKEGSEELGLTIDVSKIEKLFTMKQQFVMNDGKYIDNEIVEVLLTELDIHGESQDELFKFGISFADNEVMGVKMEHFSIVEQKLLENDSTYVPKAMLNSDNTKGPYSQLFDVLRSRYQ